MTGLAVLILCALLALCAPLLASARGLDVTRASGPLLAGPSLAYPLGTDATGRSVLTLALWGARMSLLVGLVAALLSTAVGAGVGVLAAQLGGLPGVALMRLTDWFLVLPALPLAITLATALGRGMLTIVLVVALTYWPSTARLVWAQALAIGGRGYLERARALGAGHWWQISRHILPGVLPVVLASSTLMVANAILLEATLAFLGLGDPNHVSWGTMLRAALTSGAVTAGAWWYLLAPGLAIVVVVLAFTLCGRAVEAALGPELTGR
jgi:peptide/nickel transport system permease protein